MASEYKAKQETRNVESLPVIQSGQLQEHGVADERRRTPRYPFIATAEVVELPDKPPINTRVTELSLYGCYIEMAQPLPQGSEIHVKAYSEGRFFEADGRVVYAVPNQGFGVAFKDVRPLYLTVLKQWLILAAQAKYSKKS